MTLPGIQIAEITTLPFETARTLLMSVGRNKHYTDITSCFRYVMRTSGVFGLF